MNAQQALDLLSPIPPEDFITITFSKKSVNKCCAIGHLVRLTSSDPDDYSITNCMDLHTEKENAQMVYKFRKATERYLEKVHKVSNESIASVNNWDQTNGYNEDNPKDRVIHLLTDMVAAGY